MNTDMDLAYISYMQCISFAINHQVCHWVRPINKYNMIAVCRKIPIQKSQINIWPDYHLSISLKQCKYIWKNTSSLYWISPKMLSCHWRTSIVKSSIYIAILSEGPVLWISFLCTLKTCSYKMYLSVSFSTWGGLLNRTTCKSFWPL